MSTSRRHIFGFIGTALAAVGLKAVAIEPKNVRLDGGDMGRATRFFSPDPGEVGVFSIELQRPKNKADEARLHDALATLKAFGANMYHCDDISSFPIYGASGGLATTDIVYFLVPNDNKAKA